MKIVATKQNITKHIEEIIQDLEDNKLYDIEIKNNREKRSLSQNEYFHSLVDKFADYENVSKVRLKNELIASYGQSQKLIVYVPEDYDAYSSDTFHLKPLGIYTEDGQKCEIMRGTHTYNKKEMSILINGLINEIKGSDAEIETMTINEKKSKWNY